MSCASPPSAGAQRFAPIEISKRVCTSPRVVSPANPSPRRTDSPGPRRPTSWLRSRRRLDLNVCKPSSNVLNGHAFWEGHVPNLTLRELAGKLNVSVATVSRALADDQAIALKTRQRVREAATRFGFGANVAARQLVSGRSGFAGFVMPVRGPNFIDSYLGEFVTGLGEGLVDHGIDLFIATAQPSRPELSVLRHVVESGRVVAFGEAFDLLYDLGHRHFGLVSISDAMTFRHMRERGLREAMAKRSDPEVTLDVVSAPRFDRGATVAAVNDLLHRDKRPTAILGLFDELALTVMEEASRAGLSIPRDLSVVGFDNITAAAYAPPGLTTFEARTRDSAREIAGMLVEIIEKKSAEPLTRLIRPNLVARASHGPVPIKRGF